MTRNGTKKSLAGSRQGGAGLGWGDAPRFWSKANREDRKENVISEVTRMEEECYKVKAVLQG